MFKHDTHSEQYEGIISFVCCLYQHQLDDAADISHSIINDPFLYDALSQSYVVFISQLTKTIRSYL